MGRGEKDRESALLGARACEDLARRGRGRWWCNKALPPRPSPESQAIVRSTSGVRPRANAHRVRTCRLRRPIGRRAPPRIEAGRCCATREARRAAGLPEGQRVACIALSLARALSQARLQGLLLLLLRADADEEAARVMRAPCDTGKAAHTQARGRRERRGWRAGGAMCVWARRLSVAWAFARMQGAGWQCEGCGGCFACWW